MDHDHDLIIGGIFVSENPWLPSILESNIRKTPHDITVATHQSCRIFPRSKASKLQHLVQASSHVCLKYVYLEHRLTNGSITRASFEFICIRKLSWVGWLVVVLSGNNTVSLGAAFTWPLWLWAEWKCKKYGYFYSCNCSGSSVPTIGRSVS